ncbi:MAG: hypothetical protein WAU45_16930 [Blastocatellia bacterium]
MRLVSFLLACAICGSVVGCARKPPAYSNINANASRPSGETQASSVDPASGADTGGSPAAPPDQTPGGAPAQPPSGGSTQPAPFKVPAFLDTQKGEVRDLPSYPSGQRLSIQYGPVPGGEMASLVLTTSDTMDSLAAFYDKVIKSNGWEVTVRNRDPEYSTWRLKKGDKEEGGVTIKRDPNRGNMIIQISRNSKLNSKK